MTSEAEAAKIRSLIQQQHPISLRSGSALALPRACRLGLAAARQLQISRYTPAASHTMVTTVATHRVAVIGAGLAGASCAHELKQLGLSPHVFDMGFRGPGGRANTRSQDGWQFDHGCQFIQASSPDMQAIMQRWEQAGHSLPARKQLHCYCCFHHDDGARCSCQ